MTALAAALALGSAVLHASWNVLLKSSADPLRLATRAVPLGTLAFTPAVAAAWLGGGRPGLPWQAFALAAAAGLVELAYFGSLSAAYRRGELSAVYPVARGSAPLLAALVGLLLLGERLGPLQLLGVAALIAGLFLTAPRSHPAALGPALLTGACIAAYTAVDRVGVRLGPFWLYAWLHFAATSLWLLPFRGRRPVAAAPDARRTVAVGLLSVGAYAMVLAALAIAPLALVAPLRESGVVLIAAWGVVRLGERERVPLKLGGAVAVLAGAALLTLG